MGLEEEKKKFEVLKNMIESYKCELLEDRKWTLNMPIETENGFNIEREQFLNNIDEKLQTLQKHKDSPYFAKLVFTDVEDGSEFKGYIGRVSVGEVGDDTDNKIVDWRAPISDLYYNGRVGHTTYSALGKYFNVDLKLKRQIVIKEGEVKSVYDFEESISNDEFLIPYLTQSANNRLKSIVSTIQEEQNKIIRLPIFKNTIVQGVAGSGKTTVALHRLSYLMYNYSKQVKPEEYLIISPNEIFMNYISNILADLDGDRANSFSINTVFEYALGNEYKILHKHTQYEYLKNNNIDTNYLKYKASKDFAIDIDRWLEIFKNKIFGVPLKINGIEVLSGEICREYFLSNDTTTVETLANNGCKKLSLALAYDERLKKLAFENVDKADITLNKKLAIKKIIESGNSGYVKKSIKTNFDVFKIYKTMINEIHNYSNYTDIKTLQKETLSRLKSNELAYDDMGAILYLFSKLSEILYYKKIKAVLIDEAQDVPIIMYMAFKQLFNSATFMIFGDIAQGIYSYEAIDTWQELTEIIEDCEILYLNRSYRTSIEIMDEAYKTLKNLGLPPVNNVLRHGENVSFYRDKNIDLIAEELNQLSKLYKNTAIICKDSEELKLAEKELAELQLVVLEESNSTFVDVKQCLITVQTAKGLEFDSVIIYDESSYTDSSLDLKMLYVAKTRALHKLVINGYNKD